jgi:hypothetical protein
MESLYTKQHELSYIRRLEWAESPARETRARPLGRRMLYGRTTPEVGLQVLLPHPKPTASIAGETAKSHR